MKALRKEARDSHEAKIVRLTGRHGTLKDPTGDMAAPGEIQVGGQRDDSIRSNGERPKARLDKPARKAGGRVKKRDDGGIVPEGKNFTEEMQERGNATMNSLPPRSYTRGDESFREERDRRGMEEMNKLSPRAYKRASGGRVKKAGTNVNIIVGGGHQQPPAAPLALGAPPAAALAGPPPGAMGVPRPPMPPGGPGLPPGAAMPPPGMPMRKRGGRVHGDEVEDKALIRKMVRSEDLKRPRKFTGGAASGVGREEKSESQRRRGPGQRPE